MAFKHPNTQTTINDLLTDASDAATAYLKKSGWGRKSKKSKNIAEHIQALTTPLAEAELTLASSATDETNTAAFITVFILLFEAKLTALYKDDGHHRFYDDIEALYDAMRALILTEPDLIHMACEKLSNIRTGADLLTGTAESFYEARSTATEAAVSTAIREKKTKIIKEAPLLPYTEDHFIDDAALDAATIAYEAAIDTDDRNTYAEIVEALIERAPDTTIPNTGKLFAVATRDNHAKLGPLLVQRFNALDEALTDLDSGHYISVPDSDGHTALWHAADQQNLSLTRWLLDNRASAWPYGYDTHNVWRGDEYGLDSNDFHQFSALYCATQHYEAAHSNSNEEKTARHIAHLICVHGQIAITDAVFLFQSAVEKGDAPFMHAVLKLLGGQPTQCRSLLTETNAGGHSTLACAAALADKSIYFVLSKRAASLLDGDGPADDPLPAALTDAQTIFNETHPLTITQDAADPPGTLTLTTGIAKGTYGSVFHAKNDLGNGFAVKFMHPEEDSDKQTFITEQAIHARCEHEHIIAYRGQFTANDDYGLIFELAEMDLYNFIMNTDLQETEQLELIAGIFSALAYLMTKEIVHGDISTGNILIKDGIAKLGDFGKAKQYNSETKKRFPPVGALEFAAPEVLSYMMTKRMFEDRRNAATTALIAHCKITLADAHKIDVHAAAMVAFMVLDPVLGASIEFKAAAFGTHFTHALNIIKEGRQPPNITTAHPAIKALLDGCIFKNPAARPIAQDAVTEINRIQRTLP